MSNQKSVREQKPIQEGYHKRGGVNPPPNSPKPNFNPPPQSPKQNPNGKQ